jgi:hypothetical protein
MNLTTTINVYETQVILYWILGVLILHIGDWHWLGWISIWYGWLTLGFCFYIGIKNKRRLREELSEHFDL